MAIDFPRSTYTAAEGVSAESWPASPSNGDTETNGAGDNFTFNGTSSLWVLDTGRTLTLSGGATYSWDGEKWIAQSHIPFRYFGPQDTDPTGLTADNEGDLYFNTVENEMRVYNGSSWDTITSVGNFNILTLSASSTAAPVGGTASFDGTATRFQLSETPNVAQQLLISINGVVQEPQSGTSPTEGFAVDGNDIIFASAPATGASFFGVQMGAAVNIGTPTNGSVTNVHVNASAAIAGSKIDPDFGSQNIVTTGDVGIGTSSPSTDLEIKGSAAGELTISSGDTSISNTDTIGLINFKSYDTSTNTNSYTGNVARIAAVAESDFAGAAGADTAIVFSNNDPTHPDAGSGISLIERMRIDSSGNVGIGTASPSSGFHVDAASGVDGPIFDSGGTNNTNHALLVRDSANSQLLRVNNNGGVAIGTSTIGSNAKLEVKSTTGAINSATLRLNGGDTNTGAINTGSTLLFAGNIGTGDRDFASVFGAKENGTSGNNDSYLAFGTRLGNTAVAERMRITSGGNVGIGKTDNLFYRLTFQEGDGDANRIGWVSTSGNRKASIDCANTAAIRFNNGTSDAEKIRIDSSGRLLVGRSSSLNVSTFEPHIQVAGTTAESASIMSGRFSNDASAPLFILHKSRGTTVSTNLALQGNDIVGRIAFYGADGTDWEEAAHIQCQVDGQVATGGDTTDMPGRLVFATTADGDHTAVERMRIASDGRIVLPSGSPGIAFNDNDTSGANVDSKSLDDYEEGTFTPIFKAGDNNATFTYNTQIGVYTKIGNRVFVDISVGTTSRSGGTGHFKIAGLPFQINNTTGAGGGSPAINNIDLNGSESCCNLSVEFHNTQSEIYTLQTFDNGGWANIQIGSVPTSSSTNYRVSFAYSTNS